MIGPIRSTYRWKGSVENAEEWLCLVKTRSDRYAEAESAIKRLHSYDAPEIIATPIVQGSAEYLDWVDVQVGARTVQDTDPA